MGEVMELEVADNINRPRQAVIKRKGGQGSDRESDLSGRSGDEEDEESEDADIKSFVEGLEADLNVWLKTERVKFNKSQR